MLVCFGEWSTLNYAKTRKNVLEADFPDAKWKNPCATWFEPIAKLFQRNFRGNKLLPVLLSFSKFFKQEDIQSL